VKAVLRFAFEVRVGLRLRASPYCHSGLRPGIYILFYPEIVEQARNDSRYTLRLRITLTLSAMTLFYYEGPAFAPANTESSSAQATCIRSGRHVFLLAKKATIYCT
jgi:hypothetical protein